MYVVGKPAPQLLASKTKPGEQVQVPTTVESSLANLLISDGLEYFDEFNDIVLDSVDTYYVVYHGCEVGIFHNW